MQPQASSSPGWGSLVGFVTWALSWASSSSMSIVDGGGYSKYIIAFGCEIPWGCTQHESLQASVAELTFASKLWASAVS